MRVLLLFAIQETENLQMEPVDYNQFDFGKRLNQYIHEIMHQGGVHREEHDLTEGQRIFLNAVRRELVKYADANRKGYPHNQLEQMESFARTIGDLHNSYFDAGMHKVSDCLYNRWKQVKEDTKKLGLAGGADQKAWVDIIEVEKTDMPAFFDA
jgi:hypothetical protein